MSKIQLILATAAALACAISCGKEDIQEMETGGDVKINITVRDLDPATRALKSGWENGDVINVYLDDVVTHTPDFTLTFDSGEWTASDLGDDAVSRLKSSGKLKGFWESSNSAVSGEGWNKWKSGTSYAFFDFPDKSNASKTGVKTVAVAQFGVDYNYDGTILSAEINSWSITTNFQLVVTGLPEGSYSLYTGSNTLTVCNDICVSGSRVDVSMQGDATETYKIGGVTNADGVAFLGYVNRANVQFDYVFYLVDNATGKKYSFTKNTSLPTYSGNVLVGAKVPFSSFTEVTP